MAVQQLLVARTWQPGPTPKVTGNCILLNTFQLKQSSTKAQRRPIVLTNSGSRNLPEGGQGAVSSCGRGQHRAIHHVRLQEG